MNDQLTIRARLSTYPLLLFLIASLLAMLSWAALVPQQAYAAYPTASEVYVNGKAMDAGGANAYITYDASTGTLTITKQTSGISVESSRSNLDLNIVVDGIVDVYARSKFDYLLPNLYGISNDTGGKLSISLTENSRLSISCSISDNAAPPTVIVSQLGGVYCKGAVSLTGAEGSQL